jgi:hypothetical protein
MRQLAAVFHRPGYLVAVAAVVVTTWMRWEAVKPHYTHVELGRLPSPDGAWVAVTDEDTIEPFWPPSAITVAGLRLVAMKPPLRDIGVLGVDTGGDDNDRPRVEWTAPRVLRVTVPLRSLLKVLTRKVDDVRIDVHFDPDDPAARAAWLNETNQGPDPVDDTAKPQ